MRNRSLHRLHAALLEIGREVSGIWLILFAIIVWVSFPLAAFVGAIASGYWIAQWLGGGNWVLWPIAIITELFLMIYVWHPHIRGVSDRAGKEMLSRG